MGVVGLLVISLVVLGVGAALLNRFLSRGEPEERIVTRETCATCNGESTRCEQECMMEASTQPVEYYDDEELDHYRGRPSDSFTDGEAEEFRDVMYSMRQDEVEGWNRSLILRGINLPDQVKDEVILLIEK